MSGHKPWFCRAPGIPRVVLLLGVWFLAPSRAAAEVEGAAPVKAATYRVFGSHSATGAALMMPGAYQAEINSILLPSATAQIVDLPFDADVVAAYLFWSGSLPRSTRATRSSLSQPLPPSPLPDPPDRDVDFTTADGTFYNDLSVDTDTSGFGRCVTTSSLGGFFYCRRNVTDIVRLQGVGNADGIYTVGDVDADAGTLSAYDSEWINAQAKYAGWSLVVIYQAATESVRRDIVLYDGFLRLDETTTAGLHTFTLGDFVVGSPALGKLTIFALEGDRQLGVPPLADPWWDFVSFRAASAPSATTLSDGANPPHNSFNSSWNGQASIDIDTYNLAGLIATGDSSAQITVGSGDGIIPVAPDGIGESFFVGWAVMTVDTLTPSFRSTQTRKSAHPTAAGPGETVYYTIDVVNTGSANATGVVLTDAVPTGARYISGSTRIDGVPAADVGSASPLASGLSLGSIAHAGAGDNSRQVTFQVATGEAACGAAVSNVATLSAAGVEPVTIGPAVTSVAASELDVPTKQVTFPGGGAPGPGSQVVYTVTVANSGAYEIGSVRLTDPLPAAFVPTGVFATSGSWTLGGGLLEVTGMRVPAGGTAQVALFGRVATVSELIAAGVSEITIDGYVISNQATVSGGCGPDEPSDDPDLAGLQATEFVLTYAPNLTTSSKGVTDLNGGFVEPGDTLRYTITAVNSGNRAVEVLAHDAAPVGTTYVPSSTRMDGGTPLSDIGGASPLVGGLSLGQLQAVGDNDRSVTFDVIVAAVANGTVISNDASLRAPLVPAADVVVVAPNVTVFAAPVLSNSSKSVRDLAAPLGVYEPGEEVEYDITLTNTGNRPATQVVVTDTLDASLRFVSASDGATAAGQLVRWNVAALPAGESRHLTLRARLLSPLDHGTAVHNRAHLECAELDPLDTPDVAFLVTSAARLVVTKVDEHGALPPRPGDPVVYRIRIRNDGSMLARELVVTDVIDPSLVGASSAGAVPTGSGLVWSSSSDPRLVALAPGDANAIDLIISAELATPLVSGTWVSNQATVEAAGLSAVLSDDPDAPGTTDPTTFAVLSNASLSVTKSAADLSAETPLRPGDRVRYTLELRVGGDAPLRDVVVSDPIDADLQAIDATASGGSLVGGALVWSAATGVSRLARLVPGDVVTLGFDATVTVAAADGTRIGNQATVSSGDLSLPVLSDDPSLPGTADVTEVVVRGDPELGSFTKSVRDATGSPLVTQPGDTLEYTLILGNDGTATADAVVVRDPIPTGLDVTVPPNATLTGGVLRWDPTSEPALAHLAMAGRVTLTYRATVQPSVANGTRIANQAQVTSDEILAPVVSDDPGTVLVDDPTAVVAASGADLGASTKVVSGLGGNPISVAQPGETVRYRIDVTNRGGSPATGVVVRDPVDSRLSVVATGGARIEGEELVWTSVEIPDLASIAPGATKSVSFDARLSQALAGGDVVLNQASIGASEAADEWLTDADPATLAKESTTLLVTASYDLATSTKQFVDPISGEVLSRAIPGRDVRILITARNTGTGTVRDVQVQDELDSSVLTNIIVRNGGTLAGNVASWVISELAPGDAGAVSLRIDARLRPVLDPGPYSNQAFLGVGTTPSIPTDDPAQPGASDATVLVVDSAVDLRGATLDVTSASGRDVLPGELLTYTLTVPNVGNASAHDLIVSDPLSASLEFVSATGGASYDPMTREVRWSLPTLVGGSSASFTLLARVAASTPGGTTIENQARVSANDVDVELTDDPTVPTPDTPTRVQVSARPSFASFTKSVVVVDAVAPDVVRPGDLLRYTLHLRNDGVTAATDVVVRDPLPTEVFSDVVLVTPGELAVGELRYASDDVPALALMLPGDEVTLVFEARLEDDLPPGTVVSNQAILEAPELPSAEPSDDPATPEVFDDATELTVRYPRLELVKSATDLSGGDVVPGDTVRFDITVTNDGNATASTLVVTDTLDGLLELVDADEAVVDGTQVSWHITALEPGEERTVSVTTKIVSSATHGQSIANQAFASGAGIAAVPSDWLVTSAPLDPVVLQVIARPGFDGSLKTVISPSGASGSVTPGTLVTYRIAVPNVGAGAAHHVQVRDRLDSLLELVATRPPAESDGDTVVWEADGLPVGDEIVVELDVRVRVGTPDGAVVANQAFVTADELSVAVPTDDPTTEALDDATTLRVRATPDLAGSPLTVEDVNGGSVQPGDVLRLRLEVRNRGDADAVGVTARLPVPSYVSVVAGSGKLNGEPLSEAVLASLVLDGVPVRSPAASVLEGVVLPQSRGAGDEVGVLEVDLRVDPRTLAGTVIEAQATLAGETFGPVRSDNPLTTATEGDPTVLVVGGGPELVLFKRAVTPTPVVSVGGRVDYELGVTNVGTGAATDVVLTDIVPAGTTYVAGSLANDGHRLSDALDGDAGELRADGAVVVRWTRIERDVSHRVSFAVRVTAGPLVRNQAQVSGGGQERASDGDPATPGSQPTLTAVEGGGEALEVRLDAGDTDGGLVEPGDVVRFAVSLHNAGAQDASDVAVRLTIEGGLTELVALPQTGVAPLDEDVPGWQVGDLAAGASRELWVSARVDPEAQSGAAIVAQALADTPVAAYASDSVHLLVGSGVGSAQVHGRLFFDRGDRDGRFDEAVDQGAAGYSVLVIPEASMPVAAATTTTFGSVAVRSVTTRSDGGFEVSGLPPGRYALAYISDAGVQCGASHSVALTAGQAQSVERVVDPSGIIYSAHDGLADPIAGASVYLYDLDTGQDLPREAVLAGQQGQVTSAQGYYRFDVRSEVLPGRFALRVVSPSPLFIFPSTARPPRGATLAEPIGIAASVGEDGRVVPSDFPEVDGDSTYYLRFDLTPETPNIVNNHVPLDRLSEQVRVTKSASRRTASVGEVVTYTVSIQNPTDVQLDREGPTGGVTLVDDLPEGLRFVEGSARLSGGAEGAQALAATLVTARAVRFAPLSLPARTTLTVRYYAVVGLKARGEQTNRARLVDSGGALLSNVAQATIRVEQDPIFDQGTVLGQVFCDDGDGVLGAGDMGLGGARVYLDTGFYVDSDVAGKFHLRGVEPGRHALKLDVNTLPPDSVMVSDALREIMLTPGLAAKVDYAVRCGWEKTLLAMTAPTKSTATTTLVIDPQVPAMAIGGAAQVLPFVDAVLTRADEDADFADGRGLAIGAPVPLRISIRVPAEVAVTRWQISFFDLDEAEVWRIAGEGPPPDRLPWELPEDGAVFADGSLHQYRIAVETAQGDLAEGRWRLFGIGLQDETRRPRDEVWEGDPFGADGKPTPATLERIIALAERLAKESGDWSVTLEVHAAPGGRRSEALITSQRQAAALMQLLVEQGIAAAHVRAIGKGDMERAKSRRVVVGLTQDAREVARLAALSYPGWLHVGDDHRVLPTARVDENVALAADGSLSVDLREESGRRVRLVRRAPWDQGVAANARAVTVPVAGSLAEGRIRVGGVSVAAPTLVARCDVQPKVARLAGDRLEAPLSFTLADADSVAHWSVRLFNPDGSVLKELEGNGAEALTWDGRTPSGQLAVQRAAYSYRCMLDDLAGNRAILPPATLQVGEGEAAVVDEMLTGDSYPPDEVVGSAASSILERAAQAWQTRPSGRIAIEVHDDDTGGRLQAQIRTARLAEALKRFLLGRGVREDALEVAAHGANRPLAAGSNEGARRLNRRVTVRVTAPPEVASVPVESPHVQVSGTELPMQADGTFQGTVTVAGDATLTVDMRRADGAAMVVRVPLYEGRVRTATGEPPRGGVPSAEVARLGGGLVAKPTAGATAAVESTPAPTSESVVTSAGRVWLPADGAKLRGERLTVMGEVEPDTCVTVNGKGVDVDERGRFASTVTLASGQSTLTVDMEQPGGGVAHVSRTYEVPVSEWFLLALADGVVGRGPKLAGMNSDTTVDLPREIYLHGRAVAYFKGRVRGSALLAGLPFDDVRVTAHVDTGKERDPALLRQLIDPERYYPVYGDSAEEVQDASSSSKVYLLVEADRSRAILGNFKASIQGIELVRFERSYFGAAVDVDEKLLAERRTEVHGFVASSSAGLVHRQIALQGTGGSMFFLKDDAIVEGSERVSLVVRDAVSGMRLVAVPATRDRDYVIDYRNGRVVFSQPVPAVVTSGWRLDQNPVRTLVGHPVFAEIEYDYQVGVVDSGAHAMALQVRQEVNRFVTVGASVIDEDRGDAGEARYRLLGGEARLHLPGNTTIEAEVAHSRAIDTDQWVSVDGGVTYGKVGRPERADGRAPEGWAVTARATGDARGSPYTLYFQRQAAGFYSGTNVFEQGQTKVGGQLRASVSERDQVRLRHDGVWSELWVEGGRRSNNRQISAVGYEHKRQGWLAGLELGHTYSDDGARIVNTDVASVYGERDVLPRLVLELQQQGIVRGDERVVLQTGDRLTTTVGARYQLGERLWLTASDAVRWSGSNAAQVGLRTDLGDGLSMYASERLLAGTGRTVNTLVLGAESRAIPGSRSYAEYQLDGAASAQSGRAVFGMENHWTIASGMTLQLSYERAQLVGRDSAPYAAQSGYAGATPGVTGYGSGALAPEQQFSASSYSSGGVFPVGVSSRDAMAVGLEYLGLRTLKLGSRFELRYDRGAAALGTPDRMTMYVQAGGDWRFERDLVLLGRLRGATVHNVDAPTQEGDVGGFTEAEFFDLSIGIALRPAHTNRYSGLLKYTRRYERRPVVGLTQFQLETSDVVSLEPIVELWWGLQAVGKVATKIFQVYDADLPRASSTTVLALARLNYHVTAMLDAGAEYRWLANMLASQTQQGALIEVAWLPRPGVAVGVGYNFSHFSDDLLAAVNRSDHGFFVRMTGRY